MDESPRSTNPDFDTGPRPPATQEAANRLTIPAGHIALQGGYEETPLPVDPYQLLIERSKSR